MDAIEESAQALSQHGLQSGPLTKSSKPDARLVYRWPTNPFVPIAGRIGTEFDERRGIFTLEDISLAGVRLRSPQLTFSPVPGDFLDCFLDFPALGELSTRVRVRYVRSSEVPGADNELTVHAEFCDIAEEHIDLISSYLARFGTGVPLSQMAKEGLAPTALGKFLEIWEERTDNSPSESTLVGAVLGEEVVRAPIALQEDRISVEVHWLDAASASQSVLDQLVIFLALPASLSSGCLCLRTPLLGDHLVSIGFARTGERDGETPAYEIDVIEALSGQVGGTLASKAFWRSIRRLPQFTDNPVTHTSLLARCATSVRNRRDPSAQNSANSEVSWLRYALHYDTMCSINPAYEANIDRVKNWIVNLNTNDSAVIYDFGAGTGNSCRMLAKTFPKFQIFHVDNNGGMNLVARQKYAQSQVDNVHIVAQDLMDFDPQPNSADFVVCMHAAYTLESPTRLLEKAMTCLKDGGYLLIIDIGRPIELGKWSAYCFYHATRRFGLMKAISIFYKGRQVIYQNRRIHAQQQGGTYWTHDVDSLNAELKSTGFEVVESGVCYGGISDFAVCRKPHAFNQVF